MVMSAEVIGTRMLLFMELFGDQWEGLASPIGVVSDLHTIHVDAKHPCTVGT